MEKVKTSCLAQLLPYLATFLQLKTMPSMHLTDNTFSSAKQAAQVSNQLPSNKITQPFAGTVVPASTVPPASCSSRQCHVCT